MTTPREWPSVAEAGPTAADVPDLGWDANSSRRLAQRRRLNVELTLAGTRRRRRDGRLSGRELALRLPEQGLQQSRRAVGPLRRQPLEHERLGFAICCSLPRAPAPPAGDALPGRTGRVDISGRAGVSAAANTPSST
jgi:hypothetical protein